MGPHTERNYKARPHGRQITNSLHIKVVIVIMRNHHYIDGWKICKRYRWRMRALRANAVEG